MREMFREEPSQFLEGMVLRTLMLQEAKKQGLSVPAKTYKDKETAKDAMSPEDSLIAELIKQKFSTPLTITQDEIKAFYVMYKDRMDGKSLAQMAPVIEQILQEAKQRQEFEKFVKGLRDSAKVEIKEDRLKKIAAKPPESDSAEDFKKALAGGKPVLVDFGANSCVPCRQMRPILKEVSKEYSEKAKVLVIDVYKFQELARQYQVQLIPTLIFFDSKGKEAFRHLGAWERESIVAKLKEIGGGAGGRVRSDEFGVRRNRFRDFSMPSCPSYASYSSSTAPFRGDEADDGRSHRDCLHLVRNDTTRMSTYLWRSLSLAFRPLFASDSFQSRETRPC